VLCNRPAAPEVVVIGIDGASWNVLNHMMHGGLMPNLKRLVDTGVSGNLTSTIPPASPPAWTSFMTGKRPGKHGIFSWWEALNHQFVPLNARDIYGKTLWQLLGEGGKIVGVYNVPMTYPLPSYPVNGYLISGILTPGVESDFTYPPSLRDELTSLVSDYAIHVPWLEYEQRRNGRQALMNDLTAKLHQRRKVALALLDRYKTDFFMVVLAGNDRMSHCLWRYIGLDPAMELDSEGQQIQTMIHSYYRQLDDTLADMLARCGPDTSIFVISDHGFGPLRKEIYINKWLAEQGFLVSSSTPWIGRMRTSLRSIARALGVTEERLRRVLGRPGAELAQGLASTLRVDWSRTVAYSNGSNSIQINLQGREPHGIVNPGSEYDEIRAQVIQRLAQLRDPETGRPPVKAIFQREEIAQGPHIRRAPDILLLMADEGYVAYECGVDVDSVFESPGWRTGGHTMQGVLVATGNHLRKNTRISGARIIDLAPTILYMMGLPIPEDMDGQILTDLFEKEFLDSNLPALTRASTPAGRDAGCRWQAEDGEIIKRRLRGLGYID